MAEVGQSSGKNANIGNCIFLDELVEGSGGPILVMVSRKWDVNNTGGRYMSSDFLISDKKGNVMHCTAKSNIAHRFVDRLQEGSLYYLRGFTVQANKDEYRVLKDSPYLIELQGSTVVSKSNEDVIGFVRHPFALIEFEKLKPTDGKYFVDVIGYVTSLGAPSMKANGRETVDFNLTNERGRHVRVSLWGELGHELIEKHKRAEGTYSTILTCMSAKYYLEELSLSSSSSTQVLDSDDIPDLQGFRMTLSNTDRPIVQRPIVQDKPPVMTIADLLQWARLKKTQVASFKGEIQITNIRTKNGWFNLTCTGGKCRKGVTRRNRSFWCEACDTPVSFPRPRFKLQLDVKDDSASVVVVLFDEPAEQLTRTTAKALLAEQDADDKIDGSALPSVLESLLNTKHIFEIRSHTYYQYGDYESFNCARVIQPDIVNNLAGEKHKLTYQGSDHMVGSPSKSTKEPLVVVTPAKPDENKKRRKFVVTSGSEESSSSVADNDGATLSSLKNRRIEDSDTQGEEQRSDAEGEYPKPGKKKFI